MSVLALCLLLFVSIVAAGPLANVSEDNKNANKNLDDFLGAEEDMYVFDDNGNLVKLDLSQDFPESLRDTEKDLHKRVSFHLYTKQTAQNPEKLLLNDVNALKRSHFNSNRPTKFITHGWMNSRKSSACSSIRKAFLDHGDYNVIVVDWSPISLRPYLWSSNRVLMISQHVSKMIDFLVSQGMRSSDVTAVGHSLGAHVAGLAAHYAKQKIAYVVAPQVCVSFWDGSKATGEGSDKECMHSGQSCRTANLPEVSVKSLDPAQPNFLTAGVGKRVARGDARYVEVIHTNAGLLGYSAAIGDADYFPNGGRKQKGCVVDVGGSCSHARSYQYYAESINSKVGFFAKRCGSYDDFKKSLCDASALMGGVLPQANVAGKYYLNTNSKSPFAIGRT